ncbi:hypothetical protein FBU30_000792 [Linnemannia zychae]|nr:hypothetical protein FBU30_000792 [Linnemannia zychae]
MTSRSSFSVPSLTSFGPFGFEPEDEFLLSHNSEDYDGDEHSTFLNEDEQEEKEYTETTCDKDNLKSRELQRREHQQGQENFDHESTRHEQLTHPADKSQDIQSNLKTTLAHQPQLADTSNSAPVKNSLMQGVLIGNEKEAMSATVSGSNDESSRSNREQNHAMGKFDADDDSQRKGWNREESGKIRVTEGVEVITRTVDRHFGKSNRGNDDPGSTQYKIDIRALENDDEGHELARCLQLTVKTETLLGANKEGERGPSGGIRNGSEKEVTLSVPGCKWSSASVSLSSSHAIAKEGVTSSKTFPACATTASPHLAVTGLNHSEKMSMDVEATTTGAAMSGTNGSLLSSKESSPAGTFTLSALSGESGITRANFGNFTSSSFFSSMQPPPKVRNTMEEMDEGEGEGHGAVEEEDGDEFERRETSPPLNNSMEVDKYPHIQMSNINYNSKENINGNTNSINKKRQYQQSVERGNVLWPMDSNHNKKRFGDTSTRVTPHDISSCVSPLSTKGSSKSILDQFDSVIVQDEQEVERATQRGVVTKKRIAATR